MFFSIGSMKLFTIYHNDICLYMYETEGGSFSNHKEIDGTRNNSGGILTSPGFPGNYTHNAVYSWTIKTGNPNSIVHLNFDYFQISEYQNHTPRCKDFLQVKNIICNIALVFMRWYWTLYISIRLKVQDQIIIIVLKKNPNQPFFNYFMTICNYD